MNQSRLLLLRASLFIVSIGVVVALTLTAFAEAPPAERAWCFRCGDDTVADFVANVLLFVPFGISAASLVNGSPARRVILAAISALMFSLLVEVLQYSGVVPGRVASGADVVSNMLGGVFGAAVLVHWGVVVFPRRDTALRLSIVYTVAVVILGVAGQWLTAPRHHAGGVDSATQASEQTAPQRSTLPYATGYGWFEQHVISATVNGTTFDKRGTGPIIVSVSSPGSIDATVTIEGRDRRTGFVPVLFVHHPLDTVHSVMVGQMAGGFALRVAVRAERFGMRMPALWVRDVKDSRATWTAQIHGRRWHFEHAALHANMFSAWMLFVPLERITADGAVSGTVLWVLLLIAPILWWSFRAARSNV